MQVYISQLMCRPVADPVYCKIHGGERSQNFVTIWSLKWLKINVLRTLSFLNFEVVLYPPM